MTIVLSNQISIDSYYYGKPVFASLNIVWYNVFTGHGPDLYGTEPASFYLMNGLLNFNFVFIAALLVLPVQGLARLLLQGEPRGPSIFLPDWLSQAPLHLWLLVFWLQPHKEERFLFPVYPLICLAGAMVIDSCQKLFYFAFVRVKSRHFLAHTRWLGLLAIGVTSLLSLSRMAALYQGYHGVTDTWMAVNQLEENVQGQTTVCVGKEWHRFPSSFFLPNQNFRIGFLKSDFKGQLPKYTFANEKRSNHQNAGTIQRHLKVSFPPGWSARTSMISIWRRSLGTVLQSVTCCCLSHMELVILVMQVYRPRWQVPLHC